LAHNAYGKDEVRVVKTRKHLDTYYVQDFTVCVHVEGVNLDLAYTKEDNSYVVPTDTLKNTIYYLALKTSTTVLEEYGVVLARHLLDRYAHLTDVSVRIEEQQWERLLVAGKPAPHSFTRGGPQLYTVAVCATRTKGPHQIQIVSGIKNFHLFSTTGSGFVKFHQCSLTTLKEDTDRLFRTILTAQWRWTSATTDIPYRARYDEVQEICKRVFAEEYSPSVQATLYKIAKMIVERVTEIEEVKIEAPNLHNWAFDFEKLGEKVVRNEVFVPTEEPKGYITCTMSRNNKTAL